LRNIVLCSCLPTAPDKYPSLLICCFNRGTYPVEHCSYSK
jgi:hypothetical protein